jgi:hypothetical protein
MIQMEDFKVGERFEVQPRNFHRRFVGKVLSVRGAAILFEIESYDRCDQDKVKEDRLVEVEELDVKHHLDGRCFFS